MKILAVSDVELGLLYSSSVKDRFRDVDLIISCGDLRYSYLEYLISMLNVPLYFVHGNHANQVEETVAGPKRSPDGGVNINLQSVRYNGLLMAGLEGSVQYNYGPFQYSQTEMWLRVISLVPAMFANRIRFGRYLDLFVTHAPPWHIHDQDDLPHHGIKAFLWFNHVFRPAYHLHGHIHVYRNTTIVETHVESTRVANVYGYKVIQINPGQPELPLMKRNQS